MKLNFGGRVLVLGCGSVSQCLQPLLLEHLRMDISKLTILDFEDNRHAVKPILEAGASYVQRRVTKGNLATLLGKYVGNGDLLIDLAWNIDCGDIIQWCHDNGVMYVNTSVEEWDPYLDAEEQSPGERTLYYRHRLLRDQVASWKKGGPSIVIEHGANPGLVSHWTKVALLDIAETILRTRRPGKARKLALEGALNAGDFAQLAQQTGVKVVHISERDTQIADRPKAVDEFVNTWSIEGFREEGVAPAELGWGTHERSLPARSFSHDYGPMSQICIAQPGMETWVRSWVPLGGEIRGMVIRHAVRSWPISSTPSSSRPSTISSFMMRSFGWSSKLRMRSSSSDAIAASVGR